MKVSAEAARCFLVARQLVGPARSLDVISLCDRVREVCPEFPGQPNLIHWSIPDPAREGATDEERYPAFERTANELAARIPCLLELIENDLSTQEVRNR